MCIDGAGVVRYLGAGSGESVRLKVSNAITVFALTFFHCDREQLQIDERVLKAGS